MEKFADIHERGAAGLAVQLRACEDVKAAADVAARHLDEVLGAYCRQGGADVERARRFGEVARASLSLMGAVNRAQARVLPGKITAVTKRFRAYLPYLSPVLTGILAILLYFSGDTNFSILALIALFAALFAGRARPDAQALPEVSATPMADPEEMERRLAYLFRTLDLSMAEDEKQADAAPLSRALLESIQMLTEAQLQKDPDFALSAVPQLLRALEQQGVSMRLFSDGYESDFDLLPAAVGGETIRPAIMMGDALILRGQATVKAS